MNLPFAIASRLRSFFVPVLVLAVLAVMVTFLVVPVRTWVAQRDLLDSRSRQYAAYEEVNDAMQDDIDALRTPAGTRQAIREQLGYLLPDERRIPMLELPDSPVTLPARWPYTLVAGIVSLRQNQQVEVREGNLDTFDPTRP